MSTDLPEPTTHPLAHPVAINEAPVSEAGVRSRVSLRRLNVGLFVIGLAWLFANSALNSVLLAAKLAILEPDDKVFLLGVMTAIAGVTTTVALFVWGAVSDLTRTRLGRRTPWIIFGAVGGAIGLVLIAQAQSFGTLLAANIFYGLTLNALPAAVLAIFPDRVPVEKRGTSSTVYGGAQVMAGAVAGIVASRFISAPNPMFYLSAGVLIVLVAAFLAIAPDYSSKDEPRAALDLSGMKEAFRFPSGAPDFYWAFTGRFLLLLGQFMVQNFMLYLLTDYIGLSDADAGNTVAVAGFASLVTIVIGTVVAGPLSDRIRRRKLPIFGASLLFGVAVLIPLTWPTATAMVLFAAVSGLGLGAFLSVDAALMTEVLPSQEARGKDLGILNTANTVPQVIAPLITSGIVTLGFGYRPVFMLAFVVILIGAFSIFKIKSVR